MLPRWIIHFQAEALHAFYRDFSLITTTDGIEIPPRSHGPPWECRLRRSASSSILAMSVARGRGASKTAFPRGAWEREKTRLTAIYSKIYVKTAVVISEKSRSIRFSIARLLALILLSGLVLAGLRSGSNDWFKLIYSLTFLSLVYAAIAARYHGAFWYGFAVAGWAYFVIGFGPWIGSPSGPPPPGAVNRNLISSVVLEFVSGTMARNDLLAWSIGPTMNWSQLRSANRGGIAHCALTILFGFVGGLDSRVLAGRPRTE